MGWAAAKRHPQNLQIDNSTSRDLACTFVPSASRLLTMIGASATHDLNGSLTGFAGATYTWDTRNRLRTLVKGGSTYTFGYGPDGLRTSKAVNGATTSFLLEGGSVVSEIAGSGTTHLLQSPVVDQPLKRGDKWFVPEKLGSTALLVNGSGTTTQSYDYKPFGALTGTPSGWSRFSALSPPALTRHRQPC